MGKSVVRFEDFDVPHCSPMTRLGASTNVFVNGIGVSRQGDNNTPHLKPPNKPPCSGHSASIAVGSIKVFANGKGVGRVQDSISGCTAVAQGSTNVFAG